MAEGLCVHIYASDERLDAYTEPEVLRTRHVVIAPCCVHQARGATSGAPVTWLSPPLSLQVRRVPLEQLVMRAKALRLPGLAGQVCAELPEPPAAEAVHSPLCSLLLLLLLWIHSLWLCSPWLHLLWLHLLWLYPL